MPKSQGPTSRKRSKNIKNVYIHKINSLFKLMGDQHTELDCLNNTRRTLSAENKQGLAIQKRQLNKDAARKARLRKKIYMELLEQTIEKLQKLNEEGKDLQKISNQMISSINSQSKQNQAKKQDQIGQYLVEADGQKVRKDWSVATMDRQKQCQLNKITVQIEKIMYPSQVKLNQLETESRIHQLSHKADKIQTIQRQIPELFSELKSISSDHASLHVFSPNQIIKDQFNPHYNPYICKTFMEEYYSKTICKKNVKDLEVDKYVRALAKMESYCYRVQQLDHEQ